MSLEAPEAEPFNPGSRSPTTSPKKGDKRNRDFGQASSWKMHVDAECPLFAEYLLLAEKANWGSLMKTDSIEIGPDCALIVVDMQADFIPVDTNNQQGGAFACAEGNLICDLIVQLIHRFASAGGCVVATRDYHPDGHCSFLPEGGHFPEHCIQGSPGSFFYPSIGECLQSERALKRKVEIAFKGYHEDVDSFGSFAYPDDMQHTWNRVKYRVNPERLHGCSLNAWTGSDILDCSYLKKDINAPPDVLASRRRKTLKQYLDENGIRKIFACGLALDFCVMDTALNGVVSGFQDVSILVDAARAAHLPGGPVGSGFLSSLDELYNKMTAKQISLRPSSSLLPMLHPRDPISSTAIPKAFPEQLGPFPLVEVRDLVMTVDQANRTFIAVEPFEIIEYLRSDPEGTQLTGTISSVAEVTLDASARAEARIPAEAVTFCFAYPIDKESLTDQQKGYFSTTTPAAAFMMLGGFVYFDAGGQPICYMALALGDSGLTFGPRHPCKKEWLEPLKGRFAEVTAPFIRDRAKWFCWINPREGPMPKNAHGCFVYLHNEDPTVHDERDCVFYVIQMSSLRAHAPHQGIIARGRASVC
mmetsp:Transcript_63993/g.134570  ORF Transcript_63993/g.134570 Transcript_63993/m.134570 type:complete len:587 (-) Transcript_63993:174-1934(-)